MAVALVAWVAIFSLETEIPEHTSVENQPREIVADSPNLASVGSSQSVSVREQGSVEGTVSEEKPDDFNLTPFTFHVEIRDSEGRPYTGVEVQAAPLGHPFVALVSTDDDGRAVVGFDAPVDELMIDVAFVDGEFDLAGIHRLSLKASSPKSIRLSLERKSIFFRMIAANQLSAIESGHKIMRDKLAARGIEWKGPKHSKLLGAARYSPESLDDHRIFGTARRRSVVQLTSGEYREDLVRMQAQVHQQLEVLRRQRERENVGVIAGTITDTEGNPVADFPVWAEFSGTSRVERQAAHSGTDGSFELVVFPGEVRCSAGIGEEVSFSDFTMTQGHVHRWDPVVSVASVVRLSLPEGVGIPGDYEVQARSEDSSGVTITRARFSSSMMLFPVHPTLPTSLFLIVTEGGISYPVHHLGELHGGDRRRIAPSELEPSWSYCTASYTGELPSTSVGPEANALLLEHRWGFRAPLVLDGEGTVGILMPAGNWEVNLSFGEYGSEALGAVLVDMSGATILPSFRPPRTCDVEVRMPQSSAFALRITLLEDEFASRVYAEERSFEPGEVVRLNLRPGKYLIDIVDSDGVQQRTTVEVLEGRLTEVKV